jgi:hypothetical protein
MKYGYVRVSTDDKPALEHFRNSVAPAVGATGEIN